MSVTKPIITMGLLLQFAACSSYTGSDTGNDHHASSNSRDVFRPKTVHSPYIATARTHEPHVAYPRHGEYTNYGLVEVAPPPVASGPSDVAYAPAQVSPTGAHRTVINQITNQPVVYGAAVQ